LKALRLFVCIVWIIGWTGTFYDASNKVIGTDFIYTDPNSLEAGETAPFDVTFYTDAVDPSDIASYKIRVSWQ